MTINWAKLEKRAQALAIRYQNGETLTDNELFLVMGYACRVATLRQGTQVAAQPVAGD